MKGKRFFSPSKVSFILVLVLSIGWGEPAGADTDATTTGVTITGGNLEFSEVPADVDFAPVVLDGTTNEYFTHFPEFSVIDARGTGDGWTVQVSASTMTDGSNTLTSGALALVQASSLTAGFTGTASNQPSIITTYGSYLPIDGESPTSIISADTNKGMGKWKINWEAGDTVNKGLRLHINPGEVKTGTYTALINWTLVSGIQ